MFDYDRLALDIRAQLAFVEDDSTAASSPTTTISTPSCWATPARPIPPPPGGRHHVHHLHSTSSSSGTGTASSSDGSGYGSPSSFATTGSQSSTATNSPPLSSPPMLLSPTLSFELNPKSSPSPSSTTTATASSPVVIAQADGFSADEIADFEQLLTSPKREPPKKYQCHICYQSGHFISDCPMRFNSTYDELTPYQGRKKCYGEFHCTQCKRKWTSQNSVANEAQSCIKCHVPVFPHKQLPVDKAVALGLVKSARPNPAKLAPIGHGRPGAAAARN